MTADLQHTTADPTPAPRGRGTGDGGGREGRSKAGGRFAATKVYKTPKQARVMKNICNGSVLVDKHVYGYSERNGWVCQELLTGKQVWSDKNKLGPGSVIYADGH